MAALELIYLGAFASGLRPARWFGTKLAPLLAACVAVSLSLAIPWGGLAIPVWVVAAALLLMVIFSTIRSRDF